MCRFQRLRRVMEAQSLRVTPLPIMVSDTIAGPVYS